MPQIEDLSPESEEEIDLTSSPKKKTVKKKKGSPYATTKSHPKARKPVDTKNKTARDFWLDGMRNGTGYLTTQSSPTIKRPKSASKAFDGSRTMGDFDTIPNGRTPRSARASPAYKPQEDMYDDIIDLKRQLNGIKEENSILSTRNRRLEEENVKKQKQIEQLLDPGKSEDIRRAMNERKPDAGAVVNSLKQKNLKLEQTLRDKEYQLSKLQSDLKSTKLEELKVENDLYYQEILRLRNAAANGFRQEARKTEHASAPSAAKVKALNATILRLTESNQRLQSECKLLKQDLDSALDGSLSSPRTSDKKNVRQRKKGKFDYEDMNRKELLRSIKELEKELERYESGSILDSKLTRSGTQVEGKLVLSGGLADRVEALDKRETELLEERQKNSDQLIRLKEDRMKFRQLVDEKEDEIKKLMREIARLETELSERAERAPTPTPRRRPSSASSTASSKRRAEEEERYRRAEELREKNSAKTIQKNWKKHKQRKQDAELDDAAVLIQSSMRGHFSRKEQLQKSEKLKYSSSVSGRSTPRSSRVHSPISELDDESGLDDAATTIQSAVRGHWDRKEQINKYKPKYPPQDESDSDSYLRSKSYSGKFQKTSQSGFGRSTITSQYSEDEEDDSDDDLIVSTPTRKKTSTSSVSKTRPSSGRSFGSKSGRESPLRGEFGTSSSRIAKIPMEESEEDSDDDIVIASSSYRKSSGKFF
ncbi:IQ domain-containing protein E-like [Ptychodera flava]|uniref:IQ domain-containing protein E-like n=1 Tax=Ptychodera flava TaxID=63121 RepID=UPI00396A9578